PKRRQRARKVAFPVRNVIRISANFCLHRGNLPESTAEWQLDFRARIVPDKISLAICQTKSRVSFASLTGYMRDVRWRCFVADGRRWLNVNSERINVGIARARNQRHHHYREC